MKSQAEQERSESRWSQIVGTPETRILMAGLTLALLLVGGLLVQWFRSPLVDQDYLGMTSINILFGRAAGLSYGYAVGLSNVAVILVNMLVETILVLITYPLFVFSWKHLLEIKLLKRYMTKLGDAAATNRNWVQKYGLIGLVLFVFIPFWMTGPVVGCIIGYLLGFNPWRNIGVVLSATYLAILCWALFLRGVQERIADYSPFATLLLVLVIILLAVTGRILHKKKTRNDHPSNSKN